MRKAVFVHGFMGSADMWGSVVLADWLMGWEVHAVHLPGHHKDHRLPDHYNITSFAEDVLSQVQFGSNDTLLLVGHSMGGYIAADIAARYPNQIHGLVLFHSKVSNDSEAKRSDRARAIELSHANTSLYISTMLRNTFSPQNLTRVITNLSELIDSAQWRISHECIRACHTAMMNREDRLAVMDAAGIRRYYFLGSEDGAIPFSAIQEELKNVAEENIWLEEGCGHMGHIEAPEASRKFFERTFREI